MCLTIKVFYMKCFHFIHRVTLSVFSLANMSASSESPCFFTCKHVKLVSLVPFGLVVGDVVGLLGVRALWPGWDGVSLLSVDVIEWGL